jgi:hypothetical protein
VIRKTTKIARSTDRPDLECWLRAMEKKGYVIDLSRGSAWGGRWHYSIHKGDLDGYGSAASLDTLIGEVQWTIEHDMKKRSAEKNSDSGATA